MYKAGSIFIRRMLPTLLCLVLIASVFMVCGISINAAVSEWAPDTDYVKGNLVTYQGKVYECLQQHRSLIGWEPTNAASLWTLSNTVPTNPSYTNTPVPTVPATNSTVGSKVSGYVIPDLVSTDLNLKSGFKVEIVGTSLSTHTDVNGYFEINVTSSLSSYSIKISKVNYLSRTVSNISAGNAVIGSSSSPVDLWAGDIQINSAQDNVINMADIMEMSKSFNAVAGETKYNADADFNKDSAVNMSDIMIVVKHFNKTMSDYPIPIIVVQTSIPTNTSTPTPTATVTPTATKPVFDGVDRTTGGIVTAHKDNPPNEGKEMAFDDSSSTKWFAGGSSTGWIQYQFADGSSYNITKYTITSANDASDRDPKNWTLKGSNDGINYTNLDSRTNEIFINRFQTNTYTFSNNTAYKYYKLEITGNNGSVDLQIAEIQLIDTSVKATSTPTPKPTPIATKPVPPTTWQEHWFEHNQLLQRIDYNDDVAVYFDNDMDRTSTTWIYPFVTKVWQYTKKVYGNYGTENRLYAVFHQGKYGGGHPSTYFDASHDYRNTIDLGAGPWNSASGWAIGATIHEVGHIVEGASLGIKNSPAFPIWGDSKWCEIYIYDVYLGIGMNSEAQSAYNSYMNTTDSFPRANTHWFRDWFYPIYRDHGGSQVLANYYKVLAQNFSKSGSAYSRDMNWGEFVHFWSGAAGVDLKPLATNAFGWPAEYETQYQQARKDFPNVKY